MTFDLRLSPAVPPGTGYLHFRDSRTFVVRKRKKIVSDTWKSKNLGMSFPSRVSIHTSMYETCFRIEIQLLSGVSHSVMGRMRWARKIRVKNSMPANVKTPLMIWLLVTLEKN